MPTKTFRMILDTTEQPPTFKITADGRTAVWAYNYETETPRALSGVNPQPRNAALRRWQNGLRAVMDEYARNDFREGAHSVVL